MEFQELSIPDVILVKSDIFSDDRGYFMETYHMEKFSVGGIASIFVQDNCAKSFNNTLRGLHFQIKDAQAKLLRCVKGRIFDVAVDIRTKSLNYGGWVGVELSDTNKYQLYIPEGFAHGYCVLSEEAEINYKCSSIYNSKYERGILWNDPEISIDWPVPNPILSEKDQNLPLLKNLNLLTHEE